MVGDLEDLSEKLSIERPLQAVVHRVLHIPSLMSVGGYLQLLGVYRSWQGAGDQQHFLGHPVRLQP